MEERFDINQALRAFDRIVTNGEKTNDKFTYQGLSAWSAIDGYTVQLSDDTVTLSIYFHSKYEFDYKNTKQLNAFIKKLSAMDNPKPG